MINTELCCLILLSARLRIFLIWFNLPQNFQYIYFWKYLLQKNMVQHCEVSSSSVRMGLEGLWKLASKPSSIAFSSGLGLDHSLPSSERFHGLFWAVPWCWGFPCFHDFLYFSPSSQKRYSTASCSSQFVLQWRLFIDDFFPLELLLCSSYQSIFSCFLFVFLQFPHFNVFCCFFCFFCYSTYIYSGCLQKFDNKRPNYPNKN